MARSIWSGYINFGLVSVPVGLYSATQEHEVDFHQFQEGTSDRIRYKRVNERTGREVDYDKIVKGHDVGGGEHVIVEREELEDIAPGKSRSLEISTFVDLDEIDPMHFQKSYYLGPKDSENASSYAGFGPGSAEMTPPKSWRSLAALTIASTDLFTCQRTDWR